MTSAAPRLAGFVVALVVLFGVGALAGGLLDPSPPKAGNAEPAAGHGAAAMTEDTGHSSMPMEVRGLGVEQDGLRLVVDTPTFERGEQGQLRFRILEQNGDVLRDFDVEHTKRMHLIVVRRDLAFFQHLHPTQRPDGYWVTPLTLEDSGSFRVFADFSHDGKPVTLATDVSVEGHYVQALIPDPAPSVDAEGFQVELADPKVTAREDAQLRFKISQGGKPVAVQPYLGANGHLVALRDGDLAFLHVHPTEGTSFEATFPTAGMYRLFLQFKVDGVVHTAPFTLEVE